MNTKTSTKDLLLKAIGACDEYGHPVKPVYWKSADQPLGRTYFIRFHDNHVTDIKNKQGLVTGYSVNVWLNDCGHTYNTIWRFAYFTPRHYSTFIDAINRIIGE
jgi:hypothetical protein